MCFRSSPVFNIPDPPPLAPPPPPPAPPTKPVPEQQAVETDINPQVREAKSDKPRNEMSQGTAELRIPLEGEVNTGGGAGGVAGGLNK
jgi:hypothetical protein